MFVIIAKRAGKPEVCFFGLPTERLRNNVVELHRGADNCFLGQAIAATPLCLLCDKFPKRFDMYALLTLRRATLQHH